MPSSLEAVVLCRALCQSDEVMRRLVGAMTRATNIIHYLYTPIQWLELIASELDSIYQDGVPALEGSRGTGGTGGSGGSQVSKLATEAANWSVLVSPTSWVSLKFKAVKGTVGPGLKESVSSRRQKILSETRELGLVVCQRADCKRGSRDPWHTPTAYATRAHCIKQRHRLQ